LIFNFSFQLNVTSLELHVMFTTGLHYVNLQWYFTLWRYVL